MTDVFGLRRLRGKLSETTKRAVDNMHRAHRLQILTEQQAGDAQEQHKNKLVIREHLVQASNDILSLVQAMDVDIAKSEEFVEGAINLYLEAVGAKKEYMDFKTHYDTSTSLTLALMSIPYVMSMVLENDETIDRALNQIGIDRVEDWVKRQDG